MFLGDFLGIPGNWWHHGFKAQIQDTLQGAEGGAVKLLTGSIHLSTNDDMGHGRVDEVQGVPARNAPEMSKYVHQFSRKHGKPL